jgi:hypothetical protein
VIKRRSVPFRNQEITASGTVVEKNVRKSFHNDGRYAATGPTLSLSIADTSGFSQKAQTAAPKTSNTAAMMNGACHDP